MKRLFTSLGTPKEGAVSRDFATGLCLDITPVSVIEPPGCSSFPSHVNDFGTLPTSFAADVEVDTFGFDNRYSGLELTPPDPTFTDLWSKISAVLQASVYVPTCYCPGQGIDKPSLTIGSPKFPAVPILPFFWIPRITGGGGGGGAPALTVRQVNPDGAPLPGGCCPDPNTFEYIEMTIAGNEIQVQAHRKEDLDVMYRTTDASTAFQNKAGFPKYCCLANPCATTIPEAPSHVKRLMHFQRWPTATTHNPYLGTNAKEPLSIIPIVVDVQCDAATGLMHFYYANLVIHDGHIADVQWNAPEPRQAVSPPPPTSPPTDPTTLPVNQDYQGTALFTSFVPLSGDCVANCDLAAADLAISGELCTPTCPADATICGVGVLAYESSASSATSANAVSQAFAAAAASAPVGCTPITSLCFVVFNDATQLFDATVKSCCP